MNEVIPVINPINYSALVWLLIKIGAVFGIFIGSFLIRKKVINSIAKEKEYDAQIKLQTNKTLEDQGSGQLILLDQKRTEVQTKIDNVNKQTDSDAEILNFFKNAQKELEKDKK